MRMIFLRNMKTGVEHMLTQWPSTLDMAIPPMKSYVTVGEGQDRETFVIANIHTVVSPAGVGVYLHGYPTDYVSSNRPQQPEEQAGRQGLDVHAGDSAYS